MLQKINFSKIKAKLKNERGSLVLDAALIIPLIIFIFYFMLSAILTIQHEIVMRYALDQTAKELSLLIPLAEGIYAELDHSIIDETINEIIPECSNEFKQSVGDLASSVFLQDFLQNQIDKWLNEGANRLSIRIPPDRRQIILDTVSDHSIQMKMKYHVKTPWTETEKLAVTYIPVWSKYDSQYRADDQNQDQTNQAEDNIWSEHNFVRGKYFRDQYKANLPFNYPTICRFQAGEVLAVRSLDLTAPSYSSSEQVSQQIEQEITSLSKFKGSNRDTGLTVGKINAADITARKLIVVIPGNSTYGIDHQIFSDLTNEASNRGVNLQIAVRGNSYRYLERPDVLSSEDDS